MWQGILQLLGVIEPNARCTARTSSVLLDLWINEWTLGNWLAVKTREEMHQQMYHGMEKPCELQEFQFRHCFCKLICMISCIRYRCHISFNMSAPYFLITATSSKLWLENQTLATSLKSPSCIHFWSQQKRDVTWKPRIVGSRVKPGCDEVVGLGGSRGMPSGNVLNLHSHKCLRTCFTVSVQETVSLPFSILIVIDMLCYYNICRPRPMGL